jgi:hypothetical protein
MPSTPHHAIPYPLGSEIPSGPAHLQTLALSIDDHVKDLTGLLSARPAAGSAGRLYHATDNGLTYRDNGTTWQALQNIPFITSWPPPAALAADGVVIDYLAATSSIYRLRYRAASSSPYKWEVISAPAIHAETLAEHLEINNTFNGTAPSVTAIREGDYWIEHGCNVYQDASSTHMTMYMSYAVGAIAAQNADAITSFQAQNADLTHFSHMRGKRKNAIPAGAAIVAKYKVSFNSGPTAHFRNRWIRIRPIRII